MDVADRAFWILLHRAWPRWKEVCLVVKPATVIQWHRQGFSIFWRWKSRPKGKRGRPAVSPELRELIRRMAQENPLWGAPRIHGELLKLGFHLSERSVQRWMPKRPSDPRHAQNWLDLPGEPSRGDRRYGLPGRSDLELRTALHSGDPAAWAALDRPYQCDQESNGCLGEAAAPGSVPLWRDPEIPSVRQRHHIRSCEGFRGQHGHHPKADKLPFALAERGLRTRDWYVAPRPAGPCDRSQREPFAAPAQELPSLLPR